MKKYYRYFLIMAAIAMSSCSYLDVSPDLGLDQEQVFSNWANYYKYFQQIYKGNKPVGMEGVYDPSSATRDMNIEILHPIGFSLTGTKLCLDTATDAADHGRSAGLGRQIKRNILTQNYLLYFTCGRFGILQTGYYIIRVANQCIENVDMLKDYSEHEAEIKDMIAQCYFLRAYAHFQVLRWYGGMAYLDHSLDENDDWDFPRISESEMFEHIADDFYKSYELFKEAGLMRRDTKESPIKGGVNVFPNGCAAIGMFARTLLYAASPLFNKKGASDWEKAAQACALAIKECEAKGYDLLPFKDWKLNWMGDQYVNEQIYCYAYTHDPVGNDGLNLLSRYQSKNKSTACGVCPTQNFIDKYETADGDVLLTEEDRAAAQALGHYNPQNPYINLDPRFYKTIVYDGCFDYGGKKVVNIYYDTATKSWPTSNITGSSKAVFGHNWGSDDSQGITNTGYYLYKYWQGQSGGSTIPAADPLLRMADLYLMYAEAVNEAYGPTGTCGDVSLTAIDAVNKIRTRAGMPNVKNQYTSSKETFRERIRNERCIELAYEGAHYYFDIRRWAIAPQTMSQPLMGMYIETCAKDAAHPNGKNYIRRMIPDNAQAVWSDDMYYMKFPDKLINRMEYLTNK